MGNVLDPSLGQMRVHALHLSNFLSYRDASIELGDLTALVGPNASGKSNAVAAIKLLQEIPSYGLQTAIARRGGFDQLRHRSRGRPYDPGIRLEFTMAAGLPLSSYELKLGALEGRRYEIKLEKANLFTASARTTFTHTRGRIESTTEYHHDDSIRYAEPPEGFRIPVGQSAVSGGGTYASYLLWDVMRNLGTVEINPARVAELQDPTSTDEFESDGSNTASFFEMLTTDQRAELIDELSALVPGITKIEPRRFSDKVTLAFYQMAQGKPREFLAKQMSDGTLRAFSILLALLRPEHPNFLVIEEPEIAIHLGALKTLVEVFRLHTDETQILITTHSADIIDSMDLDELRVVWSDDGMSHISRVAPHTREPVRKGLVTPGELLRTDALDPVVA